MTPWEDRYHVERVLGVGAMGKVYLARDAKLGRDVALKTLGRRDDPDVVRRFQLEARAIAELKHPNVVALYDYGGEDASELYLVMEYVPGKTIAALTKTEPLNEITTLCVGHEVALALEHAHEHGVVHRDVKPENLLMHRGRVVLTDFGAVKEIAVGATKGDATRPIGTPGFMAPEQFSGDAVSPRTDLFALGATMYTLITGQVPYEGGTVEKTYQNLLQGDYNDPRQGRPLLSPPFCSLLASCLAPKQRDRWEDATKVRMEIDRLLKERGVHDVRGELASFEENPAQTQVQQRERAIDKLVADLKVALKDKKARRASTLVQRLRELAPVDGRLDDISGVSFSTTVVKPVLSMRDYKQRRRVWLLGGFVLGSVLTGAVGVAVLMYLGTL